MKKRYFFLTILLVLMLLLLLKPVLSQNMSDSYNKANSMLVAGNFEKAAEYYNHVIQRNPNSADAYLGLGMAYKELGRYDDAYKATRMAIKLKPSYYQAYYNLGLILEMQGRNQEAIQAYDKFLDEVPGAEKFSDARQRINRLKKI
ncbi:MAG: tetratricopeptide repeat protein [Candidatus Gastranaerophilales bacterium]|nr:tetratricopeptide repeat protein [Candidatus Gastranaerophilales bacterium]